AEVAPDRSRVLGPDPTDDPRRALHADVDLARAAGPGRAVGIGLGLGLGLEPAQHGGAHVFAEESVGSEGARAVGGQSALGGLDLHLVDLGAGDVGPGADLVVAAQVDAPVGRIPPPPLEDHLAHAIPEHAGTDLRLLHPT